MDGYETEVDMKMQRILINALRYAEFIGTDDYKESLKQYSRLIFQRFIEEKLVHSSNLIRKIYIFIINTAQLFDDVIMNDSITKTYILLVL